MTDERWKECTNHHHGCACREHEWEERVATLKAELELVKSNYEYLKGDWNKTCELTKEHCPCPLGTSHITYGIPRLAERARRLEEEVARLTEKVDEKEDNLLSARSVITAVRAELLASQVPLGPHSKAPKTLKVHILDAIMLMKGQP